MTRKQFKDGLELNGKIKVEIQVALVLQVLAEYVTSEWSAPAMSQLMHGLQEEILDPVFLRERQAELQGVQDQQEEVVKRVTGMNLPGMFNFPEEDE